ncbi:MAG: acyl-CoA dehydrogenase C-terminal domain-containing protein, partial [Myxococcota bacterium]|nr:acyl-CoA dehydrogenase C-terminal domain-containing protein [Myxococcota bacterium]
TALIRAFCDESKDDEALGEFVAPLQACNERWEELTKIVSERAIKDLDELGAASVDFAMLSGYVVVGYLWTRMAQASQARLAAGQGDSTFHEAKLTTARFYFARILPRVEVHATAALAGAESVMSIPDEGFGD